MSQSDFLATAIANIETFGEHIVDELKPSFAEALGDLKQAAGVVAAAGVTVGANEISTSVPIVGPELAPLLVSFADSLIAKLEGLKASVAAAPAARSGMTSTGSCSSAQ